MSGTSAPLRFEAVAIPHSAAPARVQAPRLEIIEDLARAEPIWRRLERADLLATPYQRYDFMAPWQRTVGASMGVTPFFVIGYDAADAPAFLWPLGRVKAGPLTIARFLGGKHANLNFALWRRDAAANTDAAMLRAILAQLATAGTRVDLLQLFNQPESWEGVANPFATLTHQPSPSFAYRGRLSPDFNALYEARTSSATRKKIRKKERTLAEHGPTRAFRAQTDDEAQRVLDAFFTQTAERMREFGVCNVFAEPGVRDFIIEAATAGISEGKPALELYGLEVDGHIVATFGAVPGERRLSMMFTSITRGPLAQWSPGLLLLINLVRMACDREIPVVDLGVGEANYKDLFCDEPEPLFDSFIGLSAVGHLAAAASRLAYGVKGRVKRTPMIWQAVTAARRLRGKPSAAE